MIQIVHLPPVRNVHRVDGVAVVSLNSSRRCLSNYHTTFTFTILRTLYYIACSVTSLEMDHICFRCDSIEEYAEVCGATGQLGTRIIESMIGGRPVET